jgi:hypothetical protein
LPSLRVIELREAEAMRLLHAGDYAGAESMLRDAVVAAEAQAGHENPLTERLRDELGQLQLAIADPRNGACRRRDIPPEATFNNFPVSFDRPLTGCKDKPLIDVENRDADVLDTGYSKSAERHSAGISAKLGDRVRVLIWLDNGANEAGLPSETARDVVINASVSTSDGMHHEISATVNASNAKTINSSMPAYGGDAHVTTMARARLAPLAEGSFVCMLAEDAREYAGSVASGAKCPDDKVEVHPPGNIPGEGIFLHDLKPGWRHAIFIVTDLRVETF